MNHFDSENFAIPILFINKFYNENLVDDVNQYGNIDPYKVQKLNYVQYTALYTEHTTVNPDKPICIFDKHRRAILQTAFNNYQCAQELRDYITSNKIPVAVLNSYVIGYTNKFILDDTERKEFTAVINIHKECPPWYKPVGYSPGYDFRGKKEAEKATAMQISLGKNGYTGNVLTQNKKTRFRFFIKYEFDEETFKALLTILKSCGIDNGEKIFQNANFNYKYIDLLVSRIKDPDTRDINKDPIYQYHECDSKCIVKELFVVPVNLLDSEKNITDPVQTLTTISPMLRSSSASSSTSSPLIPLSRSSSGRASPSLIDHSRSMQNENWRQHLDSPSSPSGKVFGSVNQSPHGSRSQSPRPLQLLSVNASSFKPTPKYNPLQLTVLSSTVRSNTAPNSPSSGSIQHVDTYNSIPLIPRTVEINGRRGSSPVVGNNESQSPTLVSRSEFGKNNESEVDAQSAHMLQALLKFKNNRDVE